MATKRSGVRTGIHGAFASSGQTMLRFEDWKSPLSLVYCKGGEGFSCRFSSSAPAFVFARCHSVFEGSAGGLSVRLDARNVLLLTPGSVLELKALTALSHLAIFLPSPALLDKVSGLYAMPRRDMAKMFGSTAVLRRTNWLNEIMHRFVFERVDAGNSSNEATSFLSSEIVKELFFLPRKDGKSADVFNLDETNLYNHLPVVKRALDYIEKNLFAPITMKELAANSFVSEATLLRAFTRELGKPPFGYIAYRRLDESLALLADAGLSVGEVGERVGYETASGFIAAFRRRFGLTPLAWRTRAASR